MTGWKVRARTSVIAHWCDSADVPICGQRRIVNGWALPRPLWPPSRVWGMFCRGCMDVAEAGWIVYPPEEAP